jgi:hypothetical protein
MEAKSDTKEEVLTSRSAAGPVFTDDSGVRAVTLQWGGRGVFLLCLGLLVAVGSTLATHISLPGLDQLSGPGAIHRLFGSDDSRAAANRSAPLNHTVARGVGLLGTANSTIPPAVPSRPTPPVKSDTTGQPGSDVSTTFRIETPLTTVTTATVPKVTRPASAPAVRSHGTTKPRNPNAATPGSANAQGSSAGRAAGSKKSSGRSPARTRRPAEVPTGTKSAPRDKSAGELDPGTRSSAQRAARGKP